MNSGTTNTDLNDMLIDFTDYVNEFYGNSDDVLYPMNHEKTGKRVTKTDITSATYDYIHLVNTLKNDRFTWGDGDSLDRERVRDILVENYGYDSSMNGGSISWIK